MFSALCNNIYVLFSKFLVDNYLNLVEYQTNCCHLMGTHVHMCVFCKVLENSVLTELAVLSSGAVLLLFVSLRNSYTQECNKFYLPNTDIEEQANKLTTLVSSEENVFKTVMSSILQWILSSGMSCTQIIVQVYFSFLDLVCILSYSTFRHQ